MCNPRFTVAQFAFVLLSVLLPITANITCEDKSCLFLQNRTSTENQQSFKDSYLNIEQEEQDLNDTDLCLPNRNANHSLIGSCLEDGRGSRHPATFLNLSSIQCFCDAKCHQYQDCCIDQVQESKVTDANLWSCRDVTQTVVPVPIYVKQTCLPKYRNNAVSYLCENEASVLFHRGEYYNYLQKIPVYSKKTGIIYRNVYCAKCNDDVDLSNWNSYFHCAFKKDNTIVSFVNADFLNNAQYDPRTNVWHVDDSGDIMCKLVIEELLRWESLKTYGARLCLDSISSCPSAADRVISRRCRSYTSYVHETGTNKVYRNFHCALCNQALANKTVCLKKPSRDTVFGIPTKHGKVWLPLLFDFNFDGDSDNQVGISHPCRLSDGQIWDPLLRTCLNMSCGRLFIEKDGKCVSSGGNTSAVGLDSDCRKVVLTADRFVLLENDSIYVNHSDTTYKNDQYETFEESDGVLRSILVCEDKERLFHFDAVQVWLSEFTLSISIICLILHLIVYSMIPKLRNRPGKILMSLSSTLICGHLFLLLGSYFRKIYWLCLANSLLTYFGYVASFLWMNVMAVDIYKTFSASGVPSDRTKIYVKYSVYAWSTSILAVVIACVTDYAAPRSLLSPKFGRGVCWFNHKQGLLLFFATPLAVILLSNIILFVVTAFNIRRVAKQTSRVNNFSDKMRFFLYVKLAVVLGLTWIFGFLAASSRVSALWYPFIILNGLQGMLIFVVFTLKRKILRSIVVKLRLRSHKYNLEKAKMTRKAFYSSLSTLTTLQTSLTSGVAPIVCGSPEMLTAVRKLNAQDSSSETTRFNGLT